MIAVPRSFARELHPAGAAVKYRRLRPSTDSGVATQKQFWRAPGHVAAVAPSI